MNDLAFFSSNFVYFPLPYHTAGTMYSKDLSYGKVSYTSSTCVPYGLFARLALTAITNLAYRSDDTSISSFTLYDLLRSLRNKHPTGKQLEKMETQLTAWSTTLITISYSSESRKSYSNLLLIDEADFRLQKNLNKDQKVFMKFSDKGKSFLIDTAIPLPQDAVRNIKQAFDFDCLSWLITSLFRLRDKENQLITWTQLATQFGFNKYNMSNFKKTFSETLFNLQQSYYPKAKVSLCTEGIMLHSSPLLTKQKNDILLPSF